MALETEQPLLQSCSFVYTQAKRTTSAMMIGIYRKDSHTAPWRRSEGLELETIEVSLAGVSLNVTIQCDRPQALANPDLRTITKHFQASVREAFREIIHGRICVSSN